MRQLLYATVDVGTVRREDDSIEVVIGFEDDGPGIAEFARDRLFEPFFTTKERGTGVGLAVVRETVRAHEGRVRVATPRLGTGARFEIALPMAQGPFATAGDGG